MSLFQPPQFQSLDMRQQISGCNQGSHEKGLPPPPCSYLDSLRVKRVGSALSPPQLIKGRHCRNTPGLLRNTDWTQHAVGTTVPPQRRMCMSQIGDLGLLSNSRRRKRSLEKSSTQRQLPQKPKMRSTKEPFRQMEKSAFPLPEDAKSNPSPWAASGQLRKSRSQMKLINFPYEQLFSFPSHATRYYKWKAKHK